jgi:DNA-binding transcriptional LysR family regulator
MEAFVVVVDTVSFSAAARRLNIGQPAVSKLVAQLEERLGVKLPGAHATKAPTFTQFVQEVMRVPSGATSPEQS